MSEFNCPSCSTLITIETLLKCVQAYDKNTRSSLAHCPKCKVAIEFQIRTNAIVVGYVYSSGSPHFEGFFDVPANGIQCRTDGQRVAYVYRGERYELLDELGFSK
jgi:transcription elongation factor Elf1